MREKMFNFFGAGDWEDYFEVVVLEFIPGGESWMVTMVLHD
jgi:hypothetical protein